MPSTWFRKGLLHLAKGDIDLSTDDIRVMLVDNDYVLDHTHEFVADGPAASELVATNYQRVSLVNKQVVEDVAGNLIRLIADNILYLALGGLVNDTVGAAIAFKFVTNDSDSLLIAFSDVVENWVTQGAADELTWPSAGICRIRLL